MAGLLYSQRQVLKMLREGMTPREIATETNVPIESVMQTWIRILVHISERVGPDMNKLHEIEGFACMDEREERR